MGAQWIHGQVENSIFEYAVKNSLVLEGYDSIDLTSEDTCAITNALKGSLHLFYTVSHNFYKYFHQNHNFILKV